MKVKENKTETKATVSFELNYFLSLKFVPFCVYFWFDISIDQCAMY